MIINFVLSSSRPPRRGRSPPVRTEHRLAVENLSSRINWQVCNCIILFFYLFPCHKCSLLQCLYLCILSKDRMEDDSLLVNGSVFSVKADWKSDLLH